MAAAKTGSFSPLCSHDGQSSSQHTLHHHLFFCTLPVPRGKIFPVAMGTPWEKGELSSAL